jgi:Tol biopolymer transport system component
VETGHPTLAPDGQRLAVGWNGDIWILDLARGTRLRLTTDGLSSNPIWSRDGTAVVFRTAGRTHDLVRKRADGSGNEELLHSNEHGVSITAWSPDGGTIAYEEDNPETGSDLWLLPLEDGARPEPFLATPFIESGLRFSPDGSLVAYVSDETGSAQIYVRPYPGSGAALPISSSGGSEPAWPRKGNELFYRNGDKMMAVTVTTEPTLASDTPRLLFEAPYFVTSIHAHYDVAPDGERFMMVTRTVDDTIPSQINIVLDWVQELDRATSEN